MDILGQSALLVALSSLGLGASTLARNVKNKLYLAFALLCLLIFFWAFSFFLEKVWPDTGFYQAHLLANIWLAPVALGFVRYMVRVSDRFSRALLDFALVSALVLTFFNLVGWDLQYAWLRDMGYILPGTTIVQLLYLMWVDRRLRKGVKRTPKPPTVGAIRRSWIYLGGLIVLLTSVMDHFPFVDEGIASSGNVGLSFYLYFISQAISQQRLLDLGKLFSRLLVLVALAIVLSALYSILFAWIQYSPGIFFLNSFIVSFLILMLLDPLRAIVGFFTQRLLTQKHQRLETVLQEGLQKLAFVLDPGALYQIMLQVLDASLASSRIAIYILSTDGTKYRKVRDTAPLQNTEKAQDREVLANHPLVQYCERQRKRGELPILLDQVLESEIERSSSKNQKEFLTSLIQSLKALGCNLMIPLIAPNENKTLGFICLTVDAPPEAWGGNWGLLSFIYPFFEQAASTLRNMEVFVRQREKERLAALGEMAAGLAHEIRNPLGAIKGAAQFLDPNLDRPESRFLKVIVEEVNRLNHVVSQFLDYSKPDGLLDVKEVDLAQLTQKTVNAVRAGLRPGVLLRYIEPTKPVLSLGVPEQIQQVMFNLVQNAVKALEGRPTGRVTISLEPANVTTGSKDVLWMVEDDGPGIKKENLDKLFIPFFTTSPSGTGLGLSICQKIIEAHRGRIEVQSEENRYARFLVYLPKAGKV